MIHIDFVKAHSIYNMSELEAMAAGVISSVTEVGDYRPLLWEPLIKTAPGPFPGCDSRDAVSPSPWWGVTGPPAGSDVARG